MQEYTYGAQMRNRGKPPWDPITYGSVRLVGQQYATTTCQCQLMYSIPRTQLICSDIACSRCETVVGYHIVGSKPCETCSRSNHNAHYHLLRYTISKSF